ncbi:MAG: hypothetical protein U9R47_04330, partial [Actinomycetota bacterium]|nr:hypothetical protein [Actinomycetota bacterium]
MTKRLLAILGTILLTLALAGVASAVVGQSDDSTRTTSEGMSTPDDGTSDDNDDSDTDSSSDDEFDDDDDSDDEFNDNESDDDSDTDSDDAFDHNDD